MELICVTQNCTAICQCFFGLKCVALYGSMLGERNEAGFWRLHTGMAFGRDRCRGRRFRENLEAKISAIKFYMRLGIPLFPVTVTPDFFLEYALVLFVIFLGFPTA